MKNTKMNIAKIVFNLSLIILLSSCARIVPYDSPLYSYDVKSNNNTSDYIDSVYSFYNRNAENQLFSFDTTSIKMPDKKALNFTTNLNKNDIHNY